MPDIIEKFRRCDRVTKAWEGGYVDHPDDPGGPTDRGVTQATYDGFRDGRGLPRRPVRGITSAEAEQLFFELFWVKGRCERLAPGVDLAAYDAMVNSGVKRGRAWLMASIGGPDWETVKRLCAKRLGFMQSLKIWKTFGKGWGRRVADIQAKGVAWALAAVRDRDAVIDALADEAQAKKQVADRQATAGGVTAAGGGGAVAADATAPAPIDAAPAAQAADWLLLGSFGAIVAVVVLVLFWRARLNREQAAAYHAAAREAAEA